MKKYIAILFFLLPYVAQAQLSVAPGITSSAGTVVPTTHLTGREEHIFVFYDHITSKLQATDSICAAQGATCSSPSTFTWWRLNVKNTKLDSLYEEYPALGVSKLPEDSLTEGGYQVIIRRADNLLPIDTLTTWIFVDTFRIDTVEIITNNCDGLRLEARTTPHLYDSYTVYNFNDFLDPLLHAGEYVFRGAQSVYWESSIGDIHEGVNNPNESWKNRKTNGYVIIDSPPPLYASSYTVDVTDVFGRQGTYTTPYAVEAVAVYPKAAVEKRDDPVAEIWTDAGTAFLIEPLLLDDEALLRLRFSHGNSINTDKYIWKGFANATSQNSDRTIVWTDTLTDVGTTVFPRMPHKGQIVDGYVPGSYTVRLVVSKNNYCVDSAEVRIAVKPSSLDSESIPNAFTPNGDMQNDYFRFVTGKEPVSMEYLRVYVYNRSGGLVYRYEGEANAWTGWDGRFMGTGNEVSEGVYFYIINGEGWDGVRHNTSEYKGSVHLFR